MAVYKRGKRYWYKFMWNGEMIRESTLQGNQNVARNQESAHRTRLSNGEVGIREKKRAPALADFLKNDFLPFATSRHATKLLTLRYYKQGCDMLVKSTLGGLRLDEIVRPARAGVCQKTCCLVAFWNQSRPANVAPFPQPCLSVGQAGKASQDNPSSG